MIIAVDCGNTNTSFGIFANKKLLHKFNFKTDISLTTFEILIKIKSSLEVFKMDITSIDLIKVATVVPEMASIFSFLDKFIKAKIVILGNEDIKILNKTYIPERVGIDRLLNTYLALKKSKNKKVLVIDFGTATTFDIGIDGKFEGGVICPGIKTWANSLFKNTSQIPLIEIKNQKGILGKNTEEAINSGIFFGYPFIVNGIVRELKAKYKILDIFITGGMCEMLKDKFEFDCTTDLNLTLKAILEA